MEKTHLGCIKTIIFAIFLAKIIFLSKNFLDGIFDVGRPPHFIFYETRRPANGRPPSKIPFQKFDPAKPIFSVFIKKYVKNAKSGPTKF